MFSPSYIINLFARTEIANPISDVTNLIQPCSYVSHHLTREKEHGCVRDAFPFMGIAICYVKFLLHGQYEVMDTKFVLEFKLSEILKLL